MDAKSLHSSKKWLDKIRREKLNKGYWAQRHRDCCRTSLSHRWWGKHCDTLACSCSLPDTSVPGYSQGQGTAPQGPLVWAWKPFLHFYINWQPMCQFWPIKHSCLACSLFPEEARNSCSRSKCHPDGSATLTHNPAERWMEAAGGAASARQTQSSPLPHSSSHRAGSLPSHPWFPQGSREHLEGFAQDRARRTIYCM